MGGTTAKYGFPYPSGTDRLMDGDNAIQALAEKVEATLGNGVSLGHSVGQAIPKNVATALVFDFEYYDTAGYHTGSSSRITIPTGQAGRYLVGYTAVYIPYATGTNRQAWIQRNGATSDRAATALGFASASYSAPMAGTATFDLVAGNYLELMSSQDSDIALNVQGNNTAAHLLEFYAVRIG